MFVYSITFFVNRLSSLLLELRASSCFGSRCQSLDCILNVRLTKLWLWCDQHYHFNTKEANKPKHSTWLSIYWCMYAIFKFSFFDSVLQRMMHCTLLVLSIHLPFKEGFQLAIFFTIFLSSIHEPIVWSYCLLNMKFKQLNWAIISSRFSCMSSKESRTSRDENKMEIFNIKMQNRTYRIRCPYLYIWN